MGVIIKFSAPDGDEFDQFKVNDNFDKRDTRRPLNIENKIYYILIQLNIIWKVAKFITVLIFSFAFYRR